MVVILAMNFLFVEVAFCALEKCEKRKKPKESIKIQAPVLKTTIFILYL